MVNHYSQKCRDHKKSTPAAPRWRRWIRRQLQQAQMLNITCWFICKDIWVCCSRHGVQIWCVESDRNWNRGNNQPTGGTMTMTMMTTITRYDAMDNGQILTHYPLTSFVLPVHDEDRLDERSSFGRTIIVRTNDVVWSAIDIQRLQWINNTQQGKSE